jgi:two-component system response regulator CpxR
MKAITLFGGKFTGTQEIAQLISSRLGFKMIRDQEIIEMTAKEYPMSERQIQKGIYHKPPYRENFSRKKKQMIAALKNTLVRLVEKEPAVYCGFIAQLLPPDLSVRVLVTSDMQQRSEKIFRDEGITGENACKHIRKEDRRFFSWTRYLKEEGLWEASAFDVAIPSDSMQREQSLKLILQALEEKTQSEEKIAIQNFRLAVQVESALTQKGLNVGISVKDQHVDLTVNNPVTLLSRFKKKLKQTVTKIPDVREVKIHVGSHFHRVDIWRRHQFQLHSQSVQEQIEKEYAQIHQRISENRSPSIERKIENHQRLWT